jgi:hypothetical protein
MIDRALWNLMREAWSELSSRFEPIVDRFVTESGLDTRDWSLMLAALTFEPDTTTPAHLMVRNPYSAAESYHSRLEKAFEMGYLTEIRTGEFCLTSLGRAETNHFITELRKAMVDADPLPADDSNRLALLLEKLVRSCLGTPPPPQIWSIRLSQRLMPSMHPPMPYIEQAFSCLAAYRDDAHLAAWQKSDLTATSLEALTYLWRDQADTFNALIGGLAHRGHSRQVYWDALTDLENREFIKIHKDRLEITESGRQFRQQIETETDHYFYKPWDVLSNTHKNEMEEILLQMRDNLKESVP